MEAIKDLDGITIKSGDSFIEVVPKSKNGFPVSIYDDSSFYTIGFGGYHDTLSSAEEAKQLFFLGLSNNCRLQVTSRGATAYHWFLEKSEGANWVRVGHLGMISFIPFWKKKKVIVLQNNILKW